MAKKKSSNRWTKSDLYFLIGIICIFIAVLVGKTVIERRNSPDLQVLEDGTLKGAEENWIVGGNGALVDRVYRKYGEFDYTDSGLKAELGHPSDDAIATQIDLSGFDHDAVGTVYTNHYETKDLAESMYSSGASAYQGFSASSYKEFDFCGGTGYRFNYSWYKEKDKKTAEDMLNEGAGQSESGIGTTVTLDPEEDLLKDGSEIRNLFYQTFVAYLPATNGATIVAKVEYTKETELDVIDSGEGFAALDRVVEGLHADLK